MFRPKPLLRLPRLLIGLLCLAGTARAYVPPPSDPPELQALAEKLVDAPDDTARDRLLADAPAALRDHPQFGHALNVAWPPVIYSGDYVRAEKLSQYARRLLLRRGDVVDATFALFWSGFIDSERGDDQAALDKFAEARRVFEAADDQYKVARVLLGEGRVHLEMGDFEQALAETRRALAISQAIGLKEETINALNTSGGIFMAQGLSDRAMEYRQQALAVAGNDVAWQVYLFHNIANVYARRGERDKAIVWMSKSLAAAEQVGDRPNFAAGLQELGNFHLQAGKFDLAETELRRALKIDEEIGDKRRQTGSLCGLGELLRQRGDEPSRREALADARRAAALARETGERPGIWRSCTLEGELQLAAHEPALAREAFEESIAAIEDTRGRLAADDVGATAFLEDKMDPYDGMVALLTQAGQPMQALAMAERAKARVLVDLLSGPHVDLTRAMTDAERVAARQSADRIADLNRQIAAAKGTDAATRPALLTELNAQLASARRACEDAEEDFFIAHPELRRRRPAHGDGSLSDAELAGLLADGKTTVLEYVVAADATFLFTVTGAPANGVEAASVVRVQRLPLDRARLYARVEAFRAAVAERGLRWETGARALGGDLLGPIRELCEHSERLIIVPDGPLWELPFQALMPDGEEAANRPARTLWQMCALSFAPSLKFLAQTPSAAPLTRRPRLLAVGNPALGNARTAAGEPEVESALDSDGIEPLPDAERQVKTLVDLYGSGQSAALVGRAAHENAFKRSAGEYDVLHFATHGFLNDVAPMYSRLLMAQTDLAADEDGYLEAWEWLPLRLHARLAVLAACESGRGKLGEGEGVLGMSWALFQAGCPAVVVSQWNVDSASTTELMIAFHRQLLAGDGLAEALRRAALDMAKNPRYRHPFYWAPFVAVGRDQAIVAKPK